MDHPFVSLTPGTLLAPVPAVMISCALPGQKPNIVTIAWAGTPGDWPVCNLQETA